MGRAVLYGLLLGLAVSAGQDVVDIGESKVKDSESETGCAMAYHMGAILDVAEKTCEAIKEVSACANNGKCGTFNELPSFQSAFDQKNAESAWKVCCFHAYEQGGE